MIPVLCSGISRWLKPNAGCFGGCLRMSSYSIDPMNQRSSFELFGCRSASAAIGVLLAISNAQATTYTWDGNDINSGPDGGIGIWGGSTINWWDGATNVAWPSSGTDNDAVFADTVGTVSVDAAGVTVNDITFNTTGYVVQGSGSGVVTLNGTTPTINTASGVTATIGAVLAGSQGLTKSGNGTLVLSGVNTYSNGTNINAGILEVATGGSLGSGNVSISAGATLSYNQAAAITLPSGISGAGNLSVTSTNNNITLSNALNLGGNVTLNSTGITNVAANITAGGALSIQPGNGNNSGLSFGATNGNSQTVTITAASINLGVAGIGSANWTEKSLVLDTSAANGNITIAGDVGRNGNAGPNPVNGVFGSFTVNAGTGTITLAASKTTSYIGNANNTFNGAVVLGNNVIFAPKDTNYNGGNITGGTVTFNGTVDLGSKSMQGATGTANPWGGGYAGTRTLTFNGNSVSNGTLGTGTSSLVFNTTGSQSVDANITNGSINSGSAGNVTKSGNGTTTFTGNNTYTGTTSVNAGTLRINGTNSGGGTFSVSSGATLGGTGSIAGALNVTGTLAPGASIESFGTGAVAFNNGSTFAYELDSASLNGDLLDSSGTLSLSGTVTLTLTELASGVLAHGSKLTLIDYVGVWNGGTFTYLGNALADDSIIMLGGNQWQFNYNDTVGGANFASDQTGSTGYVTMTVVPEPSIVLLGGLGALGLLRRRRD